MCDNCDTHFDKRFDFAPLRQPLCTHALRHLERVALDTGNDSVRVGSLLCTLIQLLDDYDLLSCLAAGKDDCDL